MPRPFTAFHFPFRLDEAAGAVQTEHDYDAYVRQLIKQVLLTSPGERIDRPDFGAGLGRYVFEPTGEATASLLETTVFSSLEQWLADLIRVDEVQTRFETGRLEVSVTYTIKARGTRTHLDLEVRA